MITPATTVVDEPTTFWFDDQPPYEPADFDDEYFGDGHAALSRWRIR